MARLKEQIRFDDPRIQAQLKNILGTSETVYHALVPFQMGYEASGRADVYVFENSTRGYTYVTGDLIGEEQKESNIGNYELMICHKDKKTDWGIHLISELAYYTLQASINSGETMALEGGPYDSGKQSIKHLLFYKYSDITIEEKKLGLMLLLGITQKEYEWIQENSYELLVEKLKEKNVYPFTDLFRKSIV